MPSPESLIARAITDRAILHEILDEEHWKDYADEATRDDALALSVLAHASAAIEQAIEATLTAGDRTADLLGASPPLGCRAMGARVASRV